MNKDNKNDLLVKNIAAIFEKEIIPIELLQKLNADFQKETDKTMNGIEKIFDDMGNQVTEFERFCSQTANEILSSQQKIFNEAFKFFRKKHDNIISTSKKIKKIVDYAEKELETSEEKILLSAPDEYFETTVFALAKLAEMRDPETGFHLERTREYSVLISQKLRLDDKFIKTIYRVGPLHDVGKVAVKDEILLKPGKLTEEEYEEIKKHTLVGGETVRSLVKNEESESYIKMAEEIVLYHHEKFNGGGYPMSLKGENIPLPARIFALADAYDAIVSKRPYKEPLPHAVAVERIIKDSGSHFDPDVVKAFVDIEQDFLEINNRYS